jgi:membrane protein implicated in regulation of membrane protease activity
LILTEGAGAVADHQMIGKMGRVTGTITPGHLGEVMVEVRGGSEAFHAYAADGDDAIPIGSRIVVVEYFPPRTVVVTRM